jgi:hypothetical protein
VAAGLRGASPETIAGAFASPLHRSQFPAATLAFSLPPNVALGKAVEAIEAAAPKLKNHIGRATGARRLNKSQDA